MKKVIAKFKNHRHRFKRYAAVVAGAAIMAGTALPGMPVSRAAASDAPVISPPITAEQTAIVNGDQDNSVKKFIANETTSIKTSLNRGWHEHIGSSWPSSDENQGLSENGHIYYRSANDRSDESSNSLSNPVEFVKEYASLYGFDPENDAFSLLYQAKNEATVQVVKNGSGQRFKIDLENRQGWRIVAVRGIGDMTHPATYQSTRTDSY